MYVLKIAFDINIYVLIMLMQLEKLIFTKFMSNRVIMQLGF